MLKSLLSASCAFVVAFLPASALAQPRTVTVNPSDIVIIDPHGYKRERPNPHAYVEYLERRVERLELAVQQLQAYIFEQQLRPGVTPLPTPRTEKNAFACSITSSFGKTYYAKGDTQIEARALALQACQKIHAAIHCEEKDVKCERQ